MPTPTHPSTQDGGSTGKSSWLAQSGHWALRGQVYSWLWIVHGRLSWATGFPGTICRGLVPAAAWNECSPSGLFFWGVVCVCARVCVAHLGDSGKLRLQGVLIARDH